MKNRLGFKYFFGLVVFFVVISPVSGEFSVREKLDNRNMPSIFAPWTQVLVNKPDLSDQEMTAKHDIFWSPEFELRFHKTEEGVQLIGDWEYAKHLRDELLQINPNMIFILQINMRGGAPNSWHLQGLYTNDFPWIRASDGSQVLGSPPEHYHDVLIDFTHPIGKETIIGQVIAVAESGLWDGVFFDFWNENGVVLEGYRTYEAEQQARIDILKGIRNAVNDDFFIIVNNTGQLTYATPYINGIFMESFRADFHNYNSDGLKRLEDILLWAEKHLKEPQVNALEAEGIGSELPVSSANLQGMRCLTTLNLTHSDGFMVYTTGVQWNEPHPHDDNYFNYRGAAFYNNPEPWITHREEHDTHLHEHHHEHMWHDFWDADLGQSVSERGQRYEGIEGLFIREFTNGWVVYNRSGKEQQIEFSEAVSGVASGVKEKRSHALPDLDGEIYLKSESGLETPPTADVNGDGVVNIQDLVIVANAFGEAAPDLNGDGVVNIQDLVIVANNF